MAVRLLTEVIVKLVRKGFQWCPTSPSTILINERKKKKGENELFSSVCHFRSGVKCRRLIKCLLHHHFSQIPVSAQVRCYQQQYANKNFHVTFLGFLFFPFSFSGSHWDVTEDIKILFISNPVWSCGNKQKRKQPFNVILEIWNSKV